MSLSYRSKTVASALLSIGFFTVAALCYEMYSLRHSIAEIPHSSRPWSSHVVVTHLPYRSEFDVKMPNERVEFARIITQQPLLWLGKGAQAFAFETQDTRFVVKFFHMARMKNIVDIGFFKELFTKETKNRRLERLNHREEIFYSSKMCFEELPDETGIVYVHLNKTDNVLGSMRLVDFFGKSHTVRGDETCFVIQKRATYLLPTLMQLMDSGRPKEAQDRIDQIFTLLFSVAKKGFFDGDDALIRNNNIGFAKENAIYIDTGHIVRRENLNIEDQMTHEFSVRLKPLHEWLRVSYPELAAYYEKREAEIMTAVKNGASDISPRHV